MLFDAVQLVRVAPTPTENPRSTVLEDAVQLVRVEPLVHEKPLVPVLSCTRQDSSAPAGPTRIAVELHPLTSRSRHLPPRAPLKPSRQLIPKAKPLIDPLSTLAR